MFRHTGKKRGFIHNMRLAVMLCLTAGFVNAYGFLAFMVLTTNVTGHAALLAVKLTEGNFHSLGIIVLWLLAFLGGAFFTGLHIAKVGRNKAYAYTIPLALEIAILLTVATLGHLYDHTNATT
ncbi:MAG TPA: YoaK family protein, partial [Chitinophaga sp.]